MKLIRIKIFLILILKNFKAETGQQGPQDGIAPNFVQKPLIKPDADGKRFCFECKIKSDPEPKITWFRDNSIIEDKGRYLIYCDKLPDNMYHACLEIDDVSMKDAGKYKVQAKNSLGESNASITLNLDSEEANSSSSGASASSGAPRFLQAPFIRQLEDKIFFECKLSADPLPTFTWFLGSAQLKNPAKYKSRIMSEGNTHTLILEINSLISKDSGDYKVVAKNQHGEADANIKLNIASNKNTRLPDGIAPHFISKPLTNQNAQSLLMQLELEANPTPSVSWFLDNKDLTELGGRFVTKIEKKSVDKYLLSLELKVKHKFYNLVLKKYLKLKKKLFLKTPKSSDAGLYRCIVVNELGECTANIFLQFKGDKAGVAKGDQIPPSIIEKPRIIKDEAKKTVRFEVRIRAKPDAQITWFREKSQLSNTKKYKIDIKKENDNVFLLSLDVNDFQPQDGGLYKVQAKNESGQSNANIYLSVEVAQNEPAAAAKKAEATKLAAPAPESVVYEEEGPKRARKISNPSAELTPNSSTPGSRKTSQPAIKLDVIDETGGNY